MNIKLTVNILICAIFLIGATLVAKVVRDQWRRMTTMDSMGHIWAAMCQTLSTNNFKQINIAQASLKFSPDIPVRNDSVVDGWENPIRVSIEKIEDGFQLDMSSSGPDGIVNTSDDIIWKRIVLGDKPIM